MGFRTKRPVADKAPANVAPSTFIQDSAAFSTEGSRAILNSNPARQGTEFVDSPEQAPIGQPTLLGHRFDALSVAAPQAKLAVSQTSDPLEQEADRVADEVMALDGEKENSQDDVDGELSDRGGRTTKLSRRPVTNATAAEAEPGEIPPAAESLLTSAISSGGLPLGGSSLNYMQPRFGHDFRQVRIHTDDAASRSAKSINAHAYTIGNDIVFAPGQYAPGTREGDRLLAHELTHVLQQTVGSEQRAETGAPPFLVPESNPNSLAQRAVAHMSGDLTRTVMRDQDPGGKDADKAWATDIRNKVQTVQDAAQAAGETLNADADVALAAIRKAQQSYVSFEAAYAEAVGRFTKAVKKAMKDAEELRNGVKTGANVALAAFGGEVGELALKTGEALEKVEKASSFVNKLQGAAPGQAGKEKKGEGEKPDVNPGATDQTDWRELLQTTIDSYQKYIKGNQSLSAITKTCLTNVKWLNTVIDGKAGDAPRSSPDGQNAENFSQGSDAALAQLKSIQKGAVSSGADVFAQHVSNALDHQTAEKIEQDVAIKWISGLSPEELSAIDDADSYLKQIGVIDKSGNRLGVDTGAWTTEWDTMVIRVRAQTEERARAMVGTVRQWGGGTVAGNAVVGSVHGDEKSSNWWNATGPGTLKDQSGGDVRVISYSMGAIDKSVSSNWEHVNESELETRLIGSVTLAVEPVTPPKKEAGGLPAD